MNEQLQQALTAILNKTMQGVDAGVSFLSAEIPDVIHQLLLWQMAKASVLFILCSLAMVGWLSFLPLVKRLYKAEKDRSVYNNKEVPWMVWISTGFIVCLFFGTGALKNLMDMLQIWIAPKIYLIEYAASLAK